MIRDAVAADIARIFEIRMAVAENRLSDPSRVTPADVQRCLDNGEMWVWQADGRIKGFSATDTRDGSVWALFIDPPYQGQGIGQALLARACDRLRDVGRKVMTLSTDPGTRADRFYRRNGWTALGLNAKGEVMFEKRRDPRRYLADPRSGATRRRRPPSQTSVHGRLARPRLTPAPRGAEDGRSCPPSDPSRPRSTP
jgi:GNAT superfamily N-acetyltransferase